ncbi:efflux transporter outer membrane subunit [Paraburkholderia caballeronis]|uniref:efflux transporter outer membrane subunit n=1 Tax=Paraburkholderia caballeronis TaxID=416943 RepID=UPI00106645A4|nr:TolC family protein [Paraburkholderia caballeronis]TDV03514.1 NodT family efflux transporter outer membrane factor (OMF) lipoprotein [Paraburkholderia caballeronis]TDV08405.1 NodT family efflux transporter outer membrane factor (OMF) lipoprotein [Paraburkholderia caballeronis]TDV19762.1 NodT family efflux transporter outer membrane factor (OMF) lipoprotein [Paraburkholderia caballeronis]
MIPLFPAPKDRHETASHRARHGSTIRRAAVTVSLAAVLLSACSSVVRVDVPPQREIPAGFQQAPPGDGAPTDLAHWWRQWQDPVLTQYIDDALAANTDLRIATARVREARAIAAMAESLRYPTLSARAGGAYGFGDLRSPAPAPDDAPDLTSYAGGVTAAWEVDLFGRRASDAEAAGLLADAAQESLRGTRLAIVGDVAQNYAEARGLQRRLDLVERSLTTLHELERYADARFRAGDATRYDVMRVREQIAAREALRPALSSQIDARVRRLAVLTGRPAQQAAPLAQPGPFYVPPAPAGELPSTVLERRPDVRAAATLVRAQAARLGSAKAELLPRFYLTFAGLDGRVRLEGLPALSGTGGLIGIGADLPIFNAGRLRSNIDANDARLQRALAQHDKTLLQTLEEVDSAYGIRHGLDRRAERMTATLDVARDNAQRAKRLYEAGQRTLQDVLDARIDALQREDELVQTQTDDALATVRLYLALGGGWSADDEASAQAARTEQE